MSIVWIYTSVGLLAVSAALTVANGEPASAELRLAEAATEAAVAGSSFGAIVCSLLLPPPRPGGLR